MFLFNSFFLGETFVSFTTVNVSKMICNLFFFLPKERQINLYTFNVNIYAILNGEQCSCTFNNPRNLLSVDL